MARRYVKYRHRTDEDTQVLDGDPYGADAWPGGIQPLAATAWEPERTRVSVLAAGGLIVSVIGLCATATGLLAPEGAAVVALGFLIGTGGLVASARPAVTGRGLAGVGAFIALAAVLLAVLAMTGRYPWLNSKTDEIPRWHAWLVGHWAWLGSLVAAAVIGRLTTPPMTGTDGLGAGLGADGGGDAEPGPLEEVA